MSRTDTWMPLYIADYLGDTARLSTLEHGAYLLLLMEYWRHGPLPDDDKVLASIVRAERKLWDRELKSAMRAFFTLGDDGLLHQKRIDKERKRAIDLSGKRRVAAQQRGTKSDSKPVAIDAAIAEAIATGLHPVSLPVVSILQGSLSRDHHKLQKNPIRFSPDSVAAGAQQMLGKVETGITVEGSTGKRVCGGFYFDDVWKRVCEAAKIDEARWGGTWKQLVGWLGEGIEPDEIIEAIQRCTYHEDYRVPQTLQFFDRQIRIVHGNRKRTG